MTNQIEFDEKIFLNPPAIKAIGALVVALIAISSAGIFTRLSEGELSPNATTFNRFWIAFLGLGLWLIIKTTARKLKENPPVKQHSYTIRDLVLLIAAGILFWGSNILWAWSLTRTSVANSTLLHNLTSLSTCLGGWLIWKRRIDNRFAIGMVLALGGASLLELKDFQIARENFIGDTAALLSSIAYAGNLMLIETLRDKFSTTTIVLWCCLMGTVLSLPISLSTGDSLLPSSWQGWLFVIGLGIICQIFGQGLVAYSLKSLSSGFVTLSTLLDPVLTAIAAWVIFAESLSFYSCVAFAVVLLGLYSAISSQYAIKIEAPKPN